MSLRNNTQYFVAALNVLPFPQLLAFTPPSARSQTNRLSICMEANESSQLKLRVTSCPTLPANTFNSETESQAPLPPKINPIHEKSCHHTVALLGEAVIVKTFRCKMDVSKFFSYDKRTRTKGTFVPSGSILI